MPYKWNPFTNNLDLIEESAGDVVGPSSSTDENIAIFDGATGKIIKDGGVGLPETDGELIIGDTAGNAQTSTLTGGTGITVTNGAGSITLDADNNGDVTAAANLDDFAVVCGDGGAKGVQTIASVGTTGQVLTSNGAGALPTFEDSGINAIQSFTPRLTFGTNDTGITYVNRTATIQQVGNYIFLRISIELSNKGTATGNVLVEDIPITLSGINALAIRFSNLTYTGDQIVSRAQGTSAIIDQVSSGGSPSPLQDTNFADNTYFQITGVAQV